MTKRKSRNRKSRNKKIYDGRYDKIKEPAYTESKDDAVYVRGDEVVNDAEDALRIVTEDQRQRQERHRQRQERQRQPQETERPQERNCVLL